jgi:hypothetical protein
MKLAAATIAILFATAAQAEDTRAWQILTPKKSDALLIYGTPKTDDTPLSFRCTPKSGQVEVLANLPAAADLAARPASVVLTSKTASANLRGRVQPAPTGGAMLATAEFSTRAPLVAAFRRTGEIGLSVLGGTVQPAPAPKAAVRKFFGACK